MADDQSTYPQAVDNFYDPASGDKMDIHDVVHRKTNHAVESIENSIGSFDPNTDGGTLVDQISTNKTEIAANAALIGTNIESISNINDNLVEINAILEIDPDAGNGNLPSISDKFDKGTGPLVYPDATALGDAVKTNGDNITSINGEITEINNDITEIENTILQIFPPDPDNPDLTPSLDVKDSDVKLADGLTFETTTQHSWNLYVETNMATQGQITTIEGDINTLDAQVNTNKNDITNINTIIDALNAGDPDAIDLAGYYKKEETYSQLEVDALLDNKADNTTVNAIEARLATAEGKIQQLETDVALRATKSELEAEIQRAKAAEAALNLGKVSNVKHDDLGRLAAIERKTFAEYQALGTKEDDVMYLVEPDVGKTHHTLWIGSVQIAGAAVI
jgi:hypothetical protein